MCISSANHGPPQSWLCDIKSSRHTTAYLLSNVCKGNVSAVHRSSFYNTRHWQAGSNRNTSPLLDLGKGAQARFPNNAFRIGDPSRFVAAKVLDWAHGFADILRRVWAKDYFNVDWKASVGSKRIAHIEVSDSPRWHLEVLQNHLVRGENAYI
jgi:hypothetical protein